MENPSCGAGRYVDALEFRERYKTFRAAYGLNFGLENEQGTGGGSTATAKLLGKGELCGCHVHEMRENKQTLAYCQ
jgi:hypothetical protein